MAIASTQSPFSVVFCPFSFQMSSSFFSSPDETSELSNELVFHVFRSFFSFFFFSFQKRKRLTPKGVYTHLINSFLSTLCFWSGFVYRFMTCWKLKSMEIQADVTNIPPANTFVKEMNYLNKMCCFFSHLQCRALISANIIWTPGNQVKFCICEFKSIWKWVKLGLQTFNILTVKVLLFKCSFQHGYSLAPSELSSRQISLHAVFTFLPQCFCNFTLCRSSFCIETWSSLHKLRRQINIILRNNRIN